MTVIATWSSEGRRAQHPPDPRSPPGPAYASVGKPCCEVALEGVVSFYPLARASGVLADADPALRVSPRAREIRHPRRRIWGYRTICSKLHAKRLGSGT
jgi:hypothetical protein